MDSSGPRGVESNQSVNQSTLSPSLRCKVGRLCSRMLKSLGGMLLVRQSAPGNRSNAVRHPGASKRLLSAVLLSALATFTSSSPSRFHSQVEVAIYKIIHRLERVRMLLA